MWSLHAHNKNQNGSVLITTVLIILILGSISLAFVTMVERESLITGSTILYHKAWGIAHAGTERAIKSLSNDGNWADTPATLYSSVSYGGGSYTVTTSNAAQDSITLTSTGTSGGSKTVISYTVTIDPDPNFPGFLTMDVSQVELTGNNIKKINLTNSRLYNSITIAKVKMTLNQSIAEMISEVQMKPELGGWNTVWSGSVAPGTLIDVTDTTIPVGETYELRLNFDNPISEDDLVMDLEIHLSDGSIYYASGIDLDE